MAEIISHPDREIVMDAGRLIPVRQQAGGPVPRAISRQLLATYGIKRMMLTLADKITERQVSELRRNMIVFRSNGRKKHSMPWPKAPASMKETWETTKKLAVTFDNVFKEYNGWQLALRPGEYPFDLAGAADDGALLLARSVVFFGDNNLGKYIHGFQAHRIIGNQKTVVRPSHSLSELFVSGLKECPPGINEHLALPAPWLWVWNIKASLTDDEITGLRFVGYRYGETPEDKGENEKREFRTLHLSAAPQEGQELLIPPQLFL